MLKMSNVSRRQNVSQRKAMSLGVKQPRTAGFTVIELIAVFLVISILAAVAVVHSGNVASQSQLVAQVATVKSHIYFAQMMAMKSNVTWGINFSSNSSYTLQENGATSTICFPNAGSATYTLPAGITITSGANPLVFDVWGSPGANNITVTITSGTSNTTITVSKITGSMT
jgi:type II secretory pathway pseudopilin PulG